MRRRHSGNPQRDAEFIRLQVDDQAKRAINKAVAKHKMSQTELATLLVERLNQMPDAVQAYILNFADKEAERIIAGHLAGVPARSA